MILRQAQYLVALARERHFARAAASCNVTQSTLSAGIKQLEEGLGVLIVERGQRFLGFTEEGERVLGWAQRVLQDLGGLQQELGEMRDGIVGQLRIGAIPVVLPVMSRLLAPFLEKHPRVDVSVLSLASADIQRQIDEFSLDVGITYLDNEPLARVRTQPLYAERYVLLTRAREQFGGASSATWLEAAGLKLCLLNQTMQNRRILDMHFREAGTEIHPALETNSLVTLWSQLKFGEMSTVVPESVLPMLGGMAGMVALPMAGPAASHVVGLVASDRDPLTPLTHAFMRAARLVDLGQAIAAAAVA